MLDTNGTAELTVHCASPLHPSSNSRNSKQLSPITPIASTIHSASANSPLSQCQQNTAEVGIGGPHFALPLTAVGADTAAGEAVSIANGTFSGNGLSAYVSKLSEIVGEPPFTEEEILEELEKLRTRSQLTSAPFNRRLLPILARYQLREKWGPAAEPYAERLVTDDGSVVPSFLPELHRIRERRQQLDKVQKCRSFHCYKIPPPPLRPQGETSTTRPLLEEELVAAKQFTRSWLGPSHKATPDTNDYKHTFNNEGQQTPRGKRIPDVFSSPQTPQTPPTEKDHTAMQSSRTKTMLVNSTIDIPNNQGNDANESRIRGMSASSLLVNSTIDIPNNHGRSAKNI